jgi:hypothetical protein
MASAVFDNAMVSLLTKKIDIQSNATTTYCVLGGASPAAYKSSFATYSQIKHSAAGGIYEIVGSTGGYVVGGSGVSTVVPTAGNSGAGITGMKTNANLVFTATGTTITCSWAYIQYALTSSTPTADANPLICYLDIGAQSVTNGTLTFTWNALGILTLTT